MSKAFTEFLSEFPAEYRHAGPLSEIIVMLLEQLTNEQQQKKSGAETQAATAVKPALRLLELGSGLGEHAVWFSHFLQQQPQCTKYAPLAQWQPTEMGAAMPPLLSTWSKWQQQAPPEVAQRVLRPVALDISAPELPKEIQPESFDIAMMVNVWHIAPLAAALNSFTLISRALKQGGRLAVYGPFKINGKHTSESNEQFERHYLQSKISPLSGIRDIEQLEERGRACGMELVGDSKGTKHLVVPENNFVMVWKKL